MKRSIILVIAMAVVLVSSVAMAADTNTLTVTANVVGTCKFNSATSTLAFGALDPSVGTDAAASTTVNFWCTKNASYTITDDDGMYETGLNANRMRHATIVTEFIPYSMSLSPTSGTGSGPSTPITLNISGTVLGTDYINAAAGNYSDTVVISITP